MNQFEIAALVPADPEANATDLLVQRVAATPDAALFSRPDGDGWKDVTAAEFHRQVVALSKGLVAVGIQPGDKIGLMCKTRYEWTLIDFATWFAGAVLVPVYETSSPAQVQWNMSDSGAIAVILEDAEHVLAVRRGPSRPPIDPERLAAPSRRPREARRCGSRRAGRRDRAPQEPRPRRRHRHADLHLRLHRTPQGLRSHPLQLRRAVAQLRRGALGGRVAARGSLHAALHHDSARLRTVHRGSLRAPPA